MRDYKGRTPLHLAAELDRSNAAECLISVPISAEVRVQDDMGNHAIASMIRTMPHVVSAKTFSEILTVTSAHLLNLY